MISFQSAFAHVLHAATPLLTTRIAISAAIGCVLAEPILADMDMPPYDKSGVDGYALNAADLDQFRHFQCIGEIPAGTLSTTKLQPGECMKIMTGAAMPNGADCVVKVEEVIANETGQVWLETIPKSGDNFCRKGEDFVTGTTLLSPGAVLQAPHIGVIASVGKAECTVIRKPKVAILSTGDEIIEPGIPLAPGKIRNSNGPMMASLIQSLGCEVDYAGIASDTADSLRTKLTQCLTNDIVLVSGGVSMGDYDLVPSILAELGVECVFHNVAIQPGKPLFFGKRGTTLVFGVPGNPVSNFSTFYLFIRPAIQKMMGYPDVIHHWLTGTLTAPLSIKSGDRDRLIPVSWAIREGSYHLTPVRLNGSADLINSCQTNGYVYLDKKGGSFEPGDHVRFIQLP